MLHSPSVSLLAKQLGCHQNLKTVSWIPIFLVLIVLWFFKSILSPVARVKFFYFNLFNNLMIDNGARIFLLYMGATR